jgi:hypothetical protein
MNKLNKLVLGLAAAGVLLAGLTGPAQARRINGLYGDKLHVETEPRDATVDLATGTDDAFIAGDVEIEGQLISIVPSTQTVSGGFTITADACGGLKRVTGTGTSDTTNTFTAPSAANKGCRMLVVNVGATDIVLDANTLFPVTSAASLTLATNGSIEVWSDGTYWRHGYWTEY